MTKTMKISQTSLKNLYVARCLRDAAQRKIDKLNKEIVDKLLEGIPAQAGKYAVTLKQDSKICVPWKAAYVDLCKEKKEDFALRESKLRKKTKPSESTSAVVFVIRKK